MAIIDTGFFSSLFKIGRAGLLFKAGKKPIVIPSTAYDEISKSRFYRDSLDIFAYNSKSKDQIIIKDVDIKETEKYFKKEEISILGAGEICCFILARQTNDTVLIDDKDARKFGTSNSIKVMSLPAYFLFCKRKKILSIEDMKEIIKNLKEKDYYEFSNEVKEELLK